MRYYVVLSLAMICSATFFQRSHAQPYDQDRHAVTVEASQIDKISIGGDIEVNIGSGEIGQVIEGEEAKARASGRTVDLTVITDAGKERPRKITVSVLEVSGEPSENFGLRAKVFAPIEGSQGAGYTDKGLVLTELGGGIPNGSQRLIGNIFGVDTRSEEEFGPFLSYDARVNADYKPSPSGTKIQVGYTLTEE